MICSACGKAAKYTSFEPVDEHLQNEWGLPKPLAKMFNKREGMICEGCGSSVRAQGLASAILDSKYGLGAKNLKEWVEKVNATNMQICELNSCHELHKILTGLKNLTYAEYGTSSEQDIENLTYSDDSFDMVLHSETLEHVNDPSRAMDECRRVLKPDGSVLFTTPVVWSRVTRVRSKLVDGKIVNVEPPSYHGQRTDDYLVFREFGRDIGALLGSKVALSFPEYQNYIFVSAKRPEKEIAKRDVAKYYFSQKIYERKNS